MLYVLVQIWGQLDSAAGSCSWITIGRIKDPEYLDFDYLKVKAMDLIQKSGYKPHANAIRLEVVSNNKPEMEVMLTDLW